MELINKMNGGVGSHESGYDRKSEVKAFDESKIGVKGLVDAGITKVPRMFHRPPNFVDRYPIAGAACVDDLSIPIIDLAAVHKDPAERRRIMDEILCAFKSWGFFQVVNHGIPVSVMEEMLSGLRRFFEQDNEVKKQLYSRDLSRPVVYNTNTDLLVSPQATWRDTFNVFMAPNPPQPDDLPQPCRDILFEYSNHVMKLGTLLFELISESLGLNPNELKRMGTAEALLLACHCYPACPEPELTLGGIEHSDKGFLTVLLQDHVSGLQVLHRDHWVDVPPLHGALIINVGDLLQLITNDKLKSVEHRVVANREHHRYSVGSFFSKSIPSHGKVYEPIKELLAEGEAPIYRGTTVEDYTAAYNERACGGHASLLHYLKL